MKNLFDAYLIVDWSAANGPKTGKDSIWCAWIGPPTEDDHQGRMVRELGNPPTRAAATSLVRSWLVKAAMRKLRVLVGFDFPFGWPHGMAQRLTPTLDSPPWQSNWKAIAAALHDDALNVSNRFEVAASFNQRISDGPAPFWARPVNLQQAPDLVTSKRSDPHYADLPKWRLTEQGLRDAGNRPQECWKLFGAGSVGSQALVGVPRVCALRDDPDLAKFSQVWPFETGFTQSPGLQDLPKQFGMAHILEPYILHAEIWPGIHQAKSDIALADPGPVWGDVPDAKQVLGLAEWLYNTDIEGELAAYFAAPHELSSKDKKTAESEEGWILGAPAPVRAPDPNEELPPYPEKMEAVIGGYFGTTYSIYSHGDGEVFAMETSQGAMNGCAPMQRIDSPVSIEAWAEFRNVLDTIGAWKWKREYQPTAPIMDGTSWIFKLSWGTYRIQSGGSNASPRHFNKLCKALSKLAGGAPFC